MFAILHMIPLLCLIILSLWRNPSTSSTKESWISPSWDDSTLWRWTPERCAQLRRLIGEAASTCETLSITSPEWLSCGAGNS
uniref:Uncharacterized protein n=1 Tax=Podoviridae sp. ctMxM32 TaxID=2823557 RepID=A0A8S5LEI8_9CAUD|nr:MAG TPA: hypothetical protein [Podoviridae sp. ctMxM32]